MTAPAHDILHKSQPATGHLMQAKRDGRQLQNIIVASSEQRQVASVVQGNSPQPALTVSGKMWLPPPSASGTSSPHGMGAAGFAWQGSRLGGALPTLLPPAASGSPLTCGHALQPGPFQRHLQAIRQQQGQQGQQAHRQAPQDGGQSLSAGLCSAHAPIPALGGVPMAALASAAPAGGVPSAAPGWPPEQPAHQPLQSWSTMLQQHQHIQPMLQQQQQQQQLASQQLQASTPHSCHVPAHHSANAVLLPSDAAGAMQNPFQLAGGAPAPPLRLTPAANGAPAMNATPHAPQHLHTPPAGDAGDNWRPQKRSRIPASRHGAVRLSGGRCNGAAPDVHQQMLSVTDTALRQAHPQLGQASAPSLRDRSGLAVPRRITDGHHHEARSGSFGSEPAATAAVPAGDGMGNGFSAQHSEAIASVFTKAATPVSQCLAGSDSDGHQTARLGSAGSGSGGLAASDAPSRPSTPWQRVLSRQLSEQAPGQQSAAADHADVRGVAAEPDARSDGQRQSPATQLPAPPPAAAAATPAAEAAGAKVNSPPPPPWATEVLTPQPSGSVPAAALPEPASGAAAEAAVQHADPAQQAAEQYGTDGSGVDSKLVAAEATRAEVIWGRVKGYPFWPVRVHAVSLLR